MIDLTFIKIDQFKRQPRPCMN